MYKIGAYVKELGRLEDIRDSLQDDFHSWSIEDKTGKTDRKKKSAEAEKDLEYIIEKISRIVMYDIDVDPTVYIKETQHIIDSTDDPDELKKAKMWMDTLRHVKHNIDIECRDRNKVRKYTPMTTADVEIVRVSIDDDQYEVSKNPYADVRNEKLEAMRKILRGTR